MTVAVLGIDWQTLADAIGLGGIYALMAVGIGLVFGVLRLVNFAYGQLVMAGAYALALVMLVATFAVAFLLQSVALLWFGPLGKISASLATLNQPVMISGVDIRKISIVATALAAASLLALVLLLGRTRVGLHMRAAAMDFRTAELLGVRAGRVIGAAVLVSGVLAAIVAVMLTVQTPLVTPDFALRDTILVLAGVVLGGMNRLVPATLGGFAIGFASGLLGGALPTNQSQYLPSFLFAAVIFVLLIRPGGLFTREGQRAVERV
ncbi:MAG: branched-chain amino acid ABC transporter permease [Actinobacteria bacterium]|nr:MAG: branched-chain amino acid ABC transporter permease [Actinomycetota bacterium]